MKAFKRKARPNPRPQAGEAPAQQTPKPARKGTGRGMTAAALTLALGAAVYLNWSFAQNAPVLAAQSGADGEVTEVTAQSGAAGGAAEVMAPADDGGAVQQAAVPAGTQTDGAAAVYDPLLEDGTGAAVQESAGEGSGKNYGEAQLVSVSKDSGTEFFEQARLTRSKARDEALDELESSLKHAALTQEEKDSLTARLSAQLAFVTKESDLETLIKAKGFADCVVMLTEDSAQVTVMTENDALTAEEVTRIRDAVLSRCPDLDAQGITVVEVK